MNVSDLCKSLFIISLQIIFARTITPPLLTFPAQNNYTWVKITVKDLVCPSSYKIPVQPGWTSININVEVVDPIRMDATPEPGWICTHLKYSTECFTQFFGSKSLKYQIHHERIGVEECLQAVKDYQEGSFIPPSFPAQRCSWMKTSWNSKNYILVTPHNPALDRYTGSYVDHLFVGGRCAAKTCKLGDDSQIWIGASPTSNCVRMIPIASVLHLAGRSRTSPIIYLSLAHYPPLSVKSVCKGSFCGKHGFITDEGVFFKSSESQFKSAPECDSSRQVKLPSAAAYTDSSVITIKLGERRNWCQLSLLEARRSGKVTQALLARFNPVYPGAGPIYRVNEGHLERTYGRYLSVSEYSGMGNEIGEVEFGRIRNDKMKIMWEDWVPSGDGKSLSGPNGFYKLDGGAKIQYSLMDDQETLHDYIVMYEHEIITELRPTDIILTNGSLFNDIIEGELDEGFNISTLIDWLGSWQYLVYIGGGAIFVIVLFCCVCRYSPKKRRQRHQQMRLSESGTLFLG